MRACLTGPGLLAASLGACVWPSSPAQPSMASAPVVSAPSLRAKANVAEAQPGASKALEIDGADEHGDAVEPQSEAEEQEEVLSRPERQWRWIRDATDDACRERLGETKAVFQPLPDRERPDAKGCGIPRGVVLRQGPTGVRYSPPIQVDCSFALRLAEIEDVIQHEVKREFDSEVVRMGTLGSYACRGVIGWLRGWSGGISEHSFGNAVDIMHFDLKNGRRISVLRHYPKNRGPAETSEAVFLRSVAGRVRRDLGLRALSPDFDVSHRDHLHFDAGSRWWR